MVKHVFLIVLLSVLSVLSLSFIDTALNGLLVVYNWFESMLNLVFSGDSIGHVVQMTLALLLVPLATGIVVGSGYWAVKRSRYPHTVGVVWGAWLIVVTMLAIKG